MVFVNWNIPKLIRLLRYYIGNEDGIQTREEDCMAVLLGRLEDFDKSKEDWTQYAEHFFIANDIADVGKKKSVFLAVVGPSTFSLLRNLVSPAKPGDKTFEELVALLQEHYNPKPSETVQRAKFHSRVADLL